MRSREMKNVDTRSVWILVKPADWKQRVDVFISRVKSDDGSLFFLHTTYFFASFSFLCGDIINKCVDTLLSYSES